MIRRIRALLGAYLGVRLPGPLGHFGLVRIRNQALTLRFDNRQSFEPHYSAFKVSEVALGHHWGVLPCFKRTWFFKYVTMGAASFGCHPL